MRFVAHARVDVQVFHLRTHDVADFISRLPVVGVAQVVLRVALDDLRSMGDIAILNEVHNLHQTILTELETLVHEGQGA